MRIAFLCSSQFALSSIPLLDRLGVLAGIACPDRAHHLAPLLEAEAGRLGLAFASISKPTVASDLARWLEACQADVALVQTFPYRIPAEALAIPPLGFYNLHPGRLPGYRGPDPVFWQIARREPVGAVTLHAMDATFDTGPVVCAEEVAIEPHDTYGVHLSVLIDAAHRCIERFAAALHAGEVQGTPQPGDGCYQPKPGPEHLTIHWATQEAGAIAALTRAANPTYDGASTFFRDVPVRLLEASEAEFEMRPQLPAGTVISTGAGRGLLALCANDTVLRLDVLRLDEGVFSGERFAALFRTQIGDAFSSPAFVS